LSFFAPPDPPDAELPVGGASGTLKETSTPESTVVTVISCSNGTGVRFGVSIAQFKAMLLKAAAEELTGN